jgi:hypothetical protein
MHLGHKRLIVRIFARPPKQKNDAIKTNSQLLFFKMLCQKPVVFNSTNLQVAVYDKRPWQRHPMPEWQTALDSLYRKKEGMWALATSDLVHVVLILQNAKLSRYLWLRIQYNLHHFISRAINWISQSKNQFMLFENATSKHEQPVCIENSLCLFFSRILFLQSSYLKFQISKTGKSQRTLIKMCVCTGKGVALERRDL